MSDPATPTTRRRVELSAGPIHYDDIGDGPPVVFVHGFLVNGTLWSGVAERLSSSHRCIVPDWPLGSHSEAMRADADLTPPGIARLVAELLETLELGEVTLVGNDSGGAICQLVVTEHPDRIGRLVLTNCDAFDKFPPGHFRLMAKALAIPGATRALALSMRVPALRRSPLAFGMLTASPLDEALLAGWTEPLTRDPAIRRDGERFFRSCDARYTRAAAAKLPRLSIPVTMAWGEEDRLFPMADAHRLAAAIPESHVVPIANAGTFTPVDRPEEVAAAIRE